MIHNSKGYFLPSQVSVVRNGIDLERFSFSPIPAKTPVDILGVGYLLPVKRWDLLLNAVAELRKRGIECRTQIAGDGPLRSELEQIVKDLGIAHCVKLVGHTDNVAKLFAEAAFVVHTADSEGCPNAVMEAMACGRATVAMDAGDIPLLIDHGKTGFVVPRGDTEALVKHMERLIADPNLCQRMGEAARVKAVTAFGLDRLVYETFQVYRASGWRN
jgi:glycosyltransferase involved in cell wall biosynthesis